ncbi:WRKY domain - like 10 [Theobroma cacao]|uniref:Probable WRKY transcription factor 27 isoform X1 n=1 Tax=Theobroma cacao TaxID=3641 RepID=A0AB32W211_THECC|nr:PREDICTED: probable WRKY transcription factor 27 isoform X1 [Theobroma cacao]WRX18251.1 WRKY domain - like 10 [Theobroma cacao]
MLLFLFFVSFLSLILFLSFTPKRKSAPSFLPSLPVSPFCPICFRKRRVKIGFLKVSRLIGVLEMAEDWDLYAVVRSCSSAANTTATASNDFTNENGSSCREDPLACLASLKFEEEDDLFSFPNLSQLRKSGSLQDSYKPFLPYADPTTTSTNQGIDPSSSSSVPGGSSGQHHQHQRLKQQQEQPTTTSIGISPPLTPTSAPIFAFGQSGNQQPPQHVQEQPQPQQQNPLHRQHQLQQRVQQQEGQRPAAILPLRNMNSQAPRSRKRKNQQKRTVCHVAVDNLSSDPWAWRKYGQKPIKGSPYPRNYYRCSSSKGCAARKQVERSNFDPNIFIVTYTGDHTHPRPTHRNSLAGSTRNKLSTIQKAASKDSAPEALPSASCSSPRSATSLSPTTPLSAPEDAAAPQHNTDDINGGEEESVDMTLETALDGESDEDDDPLIPNDHVDEDLFKGLEELVGGADAGSTSSGLGTSPAFGDDFPSWGSGNSTAAAGGGC